MSHQHLRSAPDLAAVPIFRGKRLTPHVPGDRVASDGVAFTDAVPALVASIERLTAAHGYAPSLRELADDLGMNLTRVHRYTRWLIDDGVITREPGKARSLKVVTDERAG